jgi:hypothetical protein
VGEPGPLTAGEAAALRASLGRIVQLLLEVIGGRRPAGQLAPLVEPSVLRYLRATRPTTPAGPLVLVSVRVCVPAEQVAELAAVIGYGHRTRALAARFEQGDDGWRCVAFRIL